MPEPSTRGQVPERFRPPAFFAGLLAALAIGLSGAWAVAAAAPRFYDVGARPRAIAVSDLNGDGRLDLAVANSGDGTVSLLFGADDGRLRAGPTLDSGREPADIEAVDLDRDGDPDLIVANHETSRITAWRNGGRGRFARAPGFPFDTGARPHIHNVAPADFDGDGWTDIAVESADTREVRVVRMGPRGPSGPIRIRLTTMPYGELGVGNVTGGRSPEILVPGHGDQTVRVIEGRRGGWSVAPWVLRLRSQPWGVTSGDVNGDGRTDIVVLETDAVSVWLATAARGFVQAPGSPFSVRGATDVAIGDLNGDGVSDVAVSPWSGSEVTVLHVRTGRTSTVRLCERSLGLTIADLDRDGRNELIAACATGRTVAIATVGGAIRAPAGPR